MDLRLFSKKAKKIVAATLVSAMCFSAICAIDNNVKNVEAAGKLGDFDKSGNVDLADTLVALKYALGIETADKEAIAIGDVSGTGSIDLSDVLCILKYALGIDEAPDVSDAPTPTPGRTVPPPPTVRPVITQTPAPTSIPLEKVEPGTPVEGTTISSVKDGLHGAEYDETTGIYTFTDKNKEAKRGIQFNNPWAGKTELRETVKDALPSYFIKEDGDTLGLIKGTDLYALNGKDKIGTVSIDKEPAEATLTDKTVVKGTVEKWSEKLLKEINGIDTKIDYLPDYAALYAKPEWSNGVSISFWAKYNWLTNLQSDAAPFLVIKNSDGCDNREDGKSEKENHTGDFALMVRLNGGVSMEGDESGNCFRASNYIAGNNGEWNYYTVTFANDWITVYVNGQELVYNELCIDKDDIGYFNNGFLTRYSPVYQIAKSDASDIRNYLKKGWLSKTGTQLEILDKECCVIGNSRYKNPDAVTIKKNSNGIYYDLLVDLITKEETQIWFGSSSETTCVCLTSSKNTGSSAYMLQSGTKLADVNCYNKELTPAEVAANFEKEYAANKTKLELK